jgi:LysM repeat protein
MAPAAAGGGEEMYTVKSGDTLTKIAKAYGTTVKAIESENNLTTTEIKVGKKLKIPAKAAAAPAPEPVTAPAPVSPTPAPAPAPGAPPQQ